jgi:NADP-dependent 3-hydroxy acid dehydrogenase YdfG
LDVKAKVAIVTGASSGIGLDTAKLLSKKGAKLALVARSK